MSRSKQNDAATKKSLDRNLFESIAGGDKATVQCLSCCVNGNSIVGMCLPKKTSTAFLKLLGEIGIRGEVCSDTIFGNIPSGQRIITMTSEDFGNFMSAVADSSRADSSGDEISFQFGSGPFGITPFDN